MPDIFDASGRIGSPQQATRQLLIKSTPPTRKKTFPPLEAVDGYSEVMRREQPSRNPFASFTPKPLNIYALIHS